MAYLCQVRQGNAPAIPLRRHSAGFRCGSRPGEVDISALHVGAHETDANAIPDVGTFVTFHQHAFDVGFDHADKGPVLVDAGDDSIEDLADAVAHDHGRNPL